MDSTKPIVIAIDVLSQLKRWLRHPAKNKGLTLSLKSSFGIDQEIEPYIKLPGHCNNAGKLDIRMSAVLLMFEGYRMYLTCGCISLRLLI